MIIDYDLICRVARRRASRLPPSIDWRDLAQETAVKMLAGRQSIDGPMQDFLRKGLVGNYQTRKQVLVLVDTSDVILRDPITSLDVAASDKQTVVQLVYDPVLTARERYLLKGVLSGASQKLLARRRHISLRRLSQLLARIRAKINDGNHVGLHELYIMRQLSIRKIAKMLNSTVRLVWTALKQYGIELRPANVVPSVGCIECGKAIHKKHRCKFHYGQMVHRYSVNAWANHVAKHGTTNRSDTAKRIWELRRKNFGPGGGNPIGNVPPEVRAERAKAGWITRKQNLLA